MLIYLARPNDAVTTEGRELLYELVDGAKEELVAWRCAIYNPIAPFDGPMNDPTACWDINEAALRRADGVLAILPSGMASVGVPMEIQTAHSLKKPVITIGTLHSMQLRGMEIKQFGVDDVVTACALLITAARTAADLREMSRSAMEAKPQLLWKGSEEFAPVKGRYEGDAGIDLVCAETWEVTPGQTVDISCGIRMQLPEGVWGLITGRSSTARSRGLHVPTSVIDNGWRGPIFVNVTNISRDTVRVEEGERVAQFIPLPLVAPGLQLQRVDELEYSDRGQRGFGSTGA